MSNLPLFLLAAPMLYVMTRSAAWAWGWHRSLRSVRRSDQQNESDAEEPGGEGSSSVTAAGRAVVRRLLFPQIVLVFLALTSYHVQIITRLSSGYPVWYWWLASLTLEDEKIRVFGRTCRPAKIVSGWMVGYALIQSGLFASFLPPA